MEKLNEKSFAELGIRKTEETKKLIIGKKKIVRPVFEIPLRHLKYNKNNGRIFFQMYSLKKKEQNDFDKYSIEQYNEEIEALIWESNIEKNEKTKTSISEYGQMEAGVVLPDGTVIDGNRRFTCLRQLSREKPEDESYQFFRAAILDKESEDLSITDKDIRKFELTVQFGQEEKVDYSSLNKALSCYNDIEENDFSYAEMADLINEKQYNIVKMVRTVKLVKEMLNFINAPDDYQLAEEMKIYFALEPLAQYLPKIENKESETEIEEKKNIYFSYLFGVRFDLPTQSLRDKLIKKIFKDPDEYKKLKDAFDNEHSEILEDKVSELKELDSSDRMDKIKEIKQSDLAKDMRKSFDTIIRRVDMKKNAERPREILNGVLESLNELNLTPFLEAGAEEQLDPLKPLLQNVEEKLQEIKKELEQ
ncbi:MAG: hypothetical protein ACOCP4_04300 [Candidatus Woesearchaeota archaeon]